MPTIDQLYDRVYATPDAYLEFIPASLQDRPLRDGHPTAYVCEGYVCQAPVTTPEALEAQYAHLTNSTIEDDLILVDVGAETVAYGRVEWWDDQAGYRIYALFGHVVPEWRRRGIGASMYALNERRIRQIARPLHRSAAVYAVLGPRHRAWQRGPAAPAWFRAGALLL